MGEEKALQRVLKTLGWTATAIPGAIGPWLVRLFQLKLISDYFAPWVQIGATVAAVLTVFLTVVFLRGRDEGQISKRLWCAVWVLVVSFVICLALRLTVGTVFVVGRVGTLLFWFLWITVYLVLFVSFTFLLVSAIMLLQTKHRSQSGES